MQKIVETTEITGVPAGTEQIGKDEIITEYESKTMRINERLARLLSVKSLVTLILTGVFSYLAINGTIGREEIMTIYTVIIAFFFGTQAMKE